jgi:hypothetical protein
MTDFLCLGPNYRALIAVCYSVLQEVRIGTRRTIVGVRLIAASLSLVGIRSCTAIYHVDFIASRTVLVRRFFHTHVQLVRGYFRKIRISFCGLPFFERLSRTVFPPFELLACFVKFVRGDICNVCHILTQVGKLGLYSGSVGGF